MVEHLLAHGSAYVALLPSKDFFQLPNFYLHTKHCHSEPFGSLRACPEPIKGINSVKKGHYVILSAAKDLEILRRFATGDTPQNDTPENVIRMDNK